MKNSNTGPKTICVRYFASHCSNAFGNSDLHIRSLLEELCNCKPFQEYVRLHFKQEATRALQSMLPR